ncbi:hypothetical protein QCA50_007674 [Cerrena zonata]|uniref:Band 7 domain-containing protein n=1 Tax=Cerrena zonata TaxID=2478898 RepID=A0AAW0GFU7_9APHY
MSLIPSASRVVGPCVRRHTSRNAARAVSRRTLVTVIPQGTEGWRLFLGQDPVRLAPGLRLSIPILHQIMHVDMRESSITIPHLPGYTADNVPVTVSGSLFYRIEDGYKSCFAVSDVKQNIEYTGTSVVRSVLGMFTYDQVICDRNEINKKLNTVLGDSISDWGVVCSRFEIQTFKPANREVERQLELQMEAERNRRKQILDTEAAVNIAEGHKRRVILESEAHLVAKENEANAEYKYVVRNAEARKLKALMEASALASQVTELAGSLAGDAKNVTPADRQLALNTLVELQRLNQLKAIASSKSNSTYFFGDKAVGTERYNIDYAEKVKMMANPTEASGPVMATKLSQSAAA